MSETFAKKVAYIKQIFYGLSSEKRYSALIELGKKLPPIEPSHKTDKTLVRGCQSTLHLQSQLINNKIEFTASADALISAGIASLLILTYGGESPETILKTPPDFLQELDIPSSLSPSRSNGLYQIHLRMKQDALKLLI